MLERHAVRCWLANTSGCINEGMTSPLVGMTTTPQSHRLPFHRALYPMPRGLVARIRAAVAEWLDREPINLDELDRRFR